MINYKLPEGLGEKIDRLEELVEDFKKGEITSLQMKAQRVAFGVYEQREHDTYMTRIRCAAGCVTPVQLEKIAEISSAYGKGGVHLTTRQELQIHYVELDDLITVIRKLKDIGLASRGGGGNTVRNVIAQDDAGIDPDEIFDVTPYAISLTTRLVAEEDSWTLPRKFKIAFSGSSRDKGRATVADVGFIASEKNGVQGFKLYLAGGYGAKAQVAKLIYDFIPASEVYQVTKAAKNLFWKYGNRKNRHAARLRYLWNTLGEEEFKRRLEEEYEAVKNEKYPPLEIENITNEFSGESIVEEKPQDETDFELWTERFVNPQKQEDLFSVLIPVKLGFIEDEKLSGLAKLLKPFGENVIRATESQNFMLRNIPERYLPNIYNFLKSCWDGFNKPAVIDNIISCAGASTCQLGICLSRGCAAAVMRMMKKSALDLDKISDLNINISGCSNSCGHHPLADIGFFGKVGRQGEKMYPAYNIVAGAVIRDGETRYSEKMGEVSARDLPGFLEELLGVYLSKKLEYKRFEDYILTDGRKDIKNICEKYEDIPDFDEDKNYYFDWGADKFFSLAERGAGECSAGIFDLIEEDIGNIKKTIEALSQAEDITQKSELLLGLVHYSARALLVTRGVEARTEKEAYDGFCEHFIETNLVDKPLEAVIRLADKKDHAGLLKKEADAQALALRILLLYEHMDNSFKFNVPGENGSPEIQGKPSGGQEKPREKPGYEPKVSKDYRGVACPMNFVKTKMELAGLDVGDILEILLDDGEPIASVPGSVKEEGHKIIEQEKIEDHWKVVIEKK